MTKLTIYIHDTPVRQSGITYEDCIRRLAEYEDTGLTPKAVKWLIEQNEEDAKDYRATIQRLEDDIIALTIKLQQYEDEGPVRLFRLLKNKYKNGE